MKRGETGEGEVEEAPLSFSDTSRDTAEKTVKGATGAAGYPFRFRG